MKVQFQTVDVFTDRQFGGNPLAVIPDARRLSDAQMQAIANEFNLAETTFVLPPSDSANTARVRIFTPRAEMPFAGHPNVGTAFVLARHDSVCGVRFNRRNMIFEEIAGLVRMTIDTDDDLATGAALAAPQQFQIARDVDDAADQGVDVDVAAGAGQLDQGHVLRRQAVDGDALALQRLNGVRVDVLSRRRARAEGLGIA